MQCVYFFVLVRIQGRMTYPTWKDRKTGETRYGAEIIVATLDYQGVGEEDAPQVEQGAAEAPAPQPAEKKAQLDRHRPLAPAVVQRLQDDLLAR